MASTPQQPRTPAHGVLELSSDGEDDERLRLALDGFETYVQVVIDGAYYGALSIRPHPHTARLAGRAGPVHPGDSGLGQA